MSEWDLMGQTMLSLFLLPELKRFRADLERRGVEAFAYMDDTALCLMGGHGRHGQIHAIPFGAGLTPSASLLIPPRPWRYLRNQYR